MVDGTIIGVDLGGTKVSAGAVRGPEITALVKNSVPAQEEAEVVLDTVADTISEVIDPAVVGIGVGVPCVVDVEAGIVREAANIPSWKEVHLKSALEDRFGVPAVINNDANAFVVGEHVYGRARGCDHVVGLTLGTGLGTGVVVAGRLYSGANCGAGELGMMDYRGVRLEDWCSGPFFPREYGAGGKELHDRIAAEAILPGDAAELCQSLLRVFDRVAGQTLRPAVYGDFRRGRAGIDRDDQVAFGNPGHNYSPPAKLSLAVVIGYSGACMEEFRSHDCVIIRWSRPTLRTRRSYRV